MGSSSSQQGEKSLVVVQAWDRLVTSSFVDTSLLRKEVALSWERCLGNHVSTSKGISTIKDIDVLIKREENERLRCAAMPHMEQLYEAIKGKGYVVILTDPLGVILDIFGDKRMQSLAESLNVVPGSDNSEKAIGTTAPGISLVRGTPIQIHAHEHFCQLYHNWSCSAAPIFDSHGQLLGSLDVSNVDPYNHPQLMLDLVNMTGKNIEMEFHFRELNRQYSRSFHYFNTVVEELSEPMVFFDEKGNIRHLNQKAQTLIGASGTNAEGAKYDAVIANYGKLIQNLQKGQPWTEVQFDTPAGQIGVEAHLRQILGENKEPMGVVGSLKKKGTVENGKSLRYTFEDFVSCNSNVAAVIEQASTVAAMDYTVLIEGESGTGKEILAQAIHNGSPRKNEPFIAINCAALPRELIQSELFGYEQGAFTGANRGGKAGKFELAEGGTIFLDEIGDMPMEAQANLLRVLQEKSITRIGGLRSVPVDVRVIAATNKDLLKQSKAGLFREDLYYRIGVINLNIPPLRQRPDDIELLLDFLIDRCPKKHLSCKKVIFSEAALRILKGYTWPGNVREMENAVISMLSMLKGDTIQPQHLPPRIPLEVGFFEAGESEAGLLGAEKQCILTALEENDGNISRAAKALHVSRATVYRKIRKYSIRMP